MSAAAKRAALPTRVARASRDEFFAERVKQIAAWRERYDGRLPTPRGHREDEVVLGRWLAELRQTARGGPARGAALSPERRAIVDELLPGWNDVQAQGKPNETRFAERVEKIAAFRRAHGRLPVSTSDECGGLGRWLGRMRTAANGGAGNFAWTSYRERTLNEELPGWQADHSPDALFDANVRALARFVVSHRRFPRMRVENPEERRLAQFRARCRAVAHGNRTTMTLSAARRAQLDAAAPGWADRRHSGAPAAHVSRSQDERFAANVLALNGFIGEHGRFPRQRGGDVTETRIAQFRYRCRNALRGLDGASMALTDERIARLDELAPGWSDVARVRE